VVDCGESGRPSQHISTQADDCYPTSGLLVYNYLQVCFGLKADARENRESGFSMDKVNIFGC
jgi:hypothetical protein